MPTQLKLEVERNNEFDRWAIAVKRECETTLEWVTVGHTPIELSRQLLHRNM